MKGMVSIEALLAMLAFFYVLVHFASVEAGHAAEAKERMASLDAGAEAEKCSIVIDAMSANPGALLKEQGGKCKGKGDRFVYYGDGNSEKRSLTIAEKVETIQKGESFTLRIENEPHYR